MASQKLFKDYDIELTDNELEKIHTQVYITMTNKLKEK